MTKKTSNFALGFIIGSIVGAVVSAFISKEIIHDSMDEEDEFGDYADCCQS